MEFLFVIIILALILPAVLMRTFMNRMDFRRYAQTNRPVHSQRTVIHPARETYDYATGEQDEGMGRQYGEFSMSGKEDKKPYGEISMMQDDVMSAPDTSHLHAEAISTANSHTVQAQAEQPPKSAPGLSGLPLSDWQRAVVLREVLGPPRGRMHRQRKVPI